MDRLLKKVQVFIYTITLNCILLLFYSDIVGVTLIVNMDLPSSINEYVDRIGCAGRLGNSGKAVSFFDPQCDQEITLSLVDTLKLVYNFYLVFIYY